LELTAVIVGRFLLVCPEFRRLDTMKTPTLFAGMASANKYPWASPTTGQSQQLVLTSCFHPFSDHFKIFKIFSSQTLIPLCTVCAVLCVAQQTGAASKRLIVVRQTFPQDF